MDSVDCGGKTSIIGQFWIVYPDQLWMIHIKSNVKRRLQTALLMSDTSAKNATASSSKQPTEFVLDFFLKFLDFSVILFCISQTLLPKTRRRHQQQAATRRKNFDVDFYYDYDYPINAEEPSRKVEQRL